MGETVRDPAHASSSNIVLIGFMGTGKTEVGRLIAAELGRPFVDTDALIEQRAGRSIVQIFAEEGEEAFRRLEADVVAEVSARPGVVIATGGGVVLSSENMMRLRRTGFIVALHADPETILSRVGAGEDRPLLRGDPMQRLMQLFYERAPLYRDADVVVDTTGLSIREVVARVLKFIADRMPGELQLPSFSEEVIRLTLGERSYEARIGRGLLARVPSYLRALGRGNRVVLLTHPRLDTLYGRSLGVALRESGFEVSTVTVPAAESSKSLRTAERVYGRLIEAKLDRDSLLIALGGGVVSDLGGFVAATFLRGIAWIAVPTTLLAQVDASIGGKTAVNHPRGKNLIGAVHQPALVVADVDTLQSLPLRQIRSGLAEVIKTAVVGAPDLFGYLERQLGAILRRHPGALLHAVRRCVAFKAEVVVADEEDRARRVVLNYGHTVGHGIEAAAGYRGVTHGEAIAVGMALEAQLAVRLGVANEDFVERQTALLAKAGLPVRLGGLRRGRPPEVSAIRAAMEHDKKARSGRLRFVLPVELGRVVVRDDVPDGLIGEVLASG
jgi:3-dehydroquinate synthase